MLKSKGLAIMLMQIIMTIVMNNNFKGRSCGRSVC